MRSLMVAALAAALAIGPAVFPLAARGQTVPAQPEAEPSEEGLARAAEAANAQAVQEALQDQATLGVDVGTPDGRSAGATALRPRPEVIAVNGVVGDPGDPKFERAFNEMVEQLNAEAVATLPQEQPPER